MMTLRLFSRKFESVPASTSWYLADLGEARGKQELFTRQSPQRLKVLREHAFLEKACPGVSRDMVRLVLRDLRANGEIECLGRGPGAPWRKREKG